MMQQGGAKPTEVRRVAYFPGCGVKDQALPMERTARAVLEQLGYAMDELERWNCCGTVYSLASDDLMRHVGSIRNLIRVQQAGADRVLTLCAMCYGTLKRSERFLRADSARLERVNAFLDDEPDYEGGVSVLHLLELLRDEVGFDALAEAVTRPLEGLKVAAYYGCTLTRPREVALDDPERPTVMEDLLVALGAEPVITPERVECCGAYLTVGSPDVVRGRVASISEAAAARGAVLMVTSCPLCQFNLDTRLAEAARGGVRAVPSLYFTQLAALALGIDPDLADSRVDPRPVLAAHGAMVEVTG